MWVCFLHTWLYVVGSYADGGLWCEAWCLFSVVGFWVDGDSAVVPAVFDAFDASGVVDAVEGDGYVVAGVHSSTPSGMSNPSRRQRNR